MAKIVSHVRSAEFYDEDDFFTLSRMPLDEHGELIEDKDTYDWQMEIRGDGQIIVYPLEGESFHFDPFTPSFRALLTQQRGVA